MKDHPALTPRPPIAKPFPIEELKQWVGDWVVATRREIDMACDNWGSIDDFPSLNERKETLHRVNDKISELQAESVTPPLLEPSLEEFENWCKDLHEDTGRDYVQDALMLIKAFKNSRQHKDCNHEGN